MCTVSWLRRDEGGYELFCNRDERRTRAAAFAPAVRVRSGVRYVAPTDSDFGGSWVGVNEHGLALCLLNNYDGRQTQARGGGRSRGLLLTDLIDGRSLSQIRARLSGSTDLSRYRPFTLLAVAPDAAPLAARWAGGRLTFDDDPRAPLTSSSFDGGRVRPAREDFFRRMVAARGGVSAEMLGEFHRGHDPERGPVSVCMHRADAATVSFSRVRVGSERVEFEYQPQAPCAGLRPFLLAIPRAEVNP